MEKRRYHCDSCHTGFVIDPLAETLTGGRLSSKLTEIVCLLAIHSTFEVTSDILSRALGIFICPSTVKEISEKVGKKCFDEELKAAGQFDEGAASAALLSDTRNPLPRRSYVQIDGSMVNTVNKWKENKLGIIFHEDDLKSTGEGEKQRVTIQKKKLVTSMALGVKDFRERLRLWMFKSRAQWAEHIVLISDGATWIANIAKELFPLCTHVLDWYHVTEALWKCAKTTYGDKSPKVRPWVEKYKNLIWEGNVQVAVEQILAQAKASKKSTALFELHTYFKDRISQMQYSDFRKQGIYIGSGAIESANKYAIQDRLKKAGMKWSIRGANAIAHLRVQYLSANWDQIWNSQAA